jgi:pimeloyl-ACP methyl ester carboxylesterase
VAPERPLFFESAGRPLFAVLHAPAGAASARPVVVHVHSLGVEQMSLYRAEVLAARAAAAAGFPVFRFHARGHGDSAGDFAAVTLEGLVEDAANAADEARRLSGAGTVVWLGVRFGALVAALAAARRSDHAGLGLWEPVHRGGDYFRGQLRGMLFSEVAAGRKPDATVEQLFERVMREGSLDVHGYLLHRALVESAREADLASALGSWSAPLLLAQISTRPRLSPANAALLAAAAARGARTSSACVTHEPGWHFMMNPAWESDALTFATKEWLDALA